MDPQAFDRLARRFSQSASRRRALAGLIGGALAAVASTGEAKRRHHRHSKDSGTTRVSASDCAKFCTAVFPPGAQRGQCVSDAAHGQGLCVLCKADPSNLCGTTCCQSPDTCGGGGTPGVCGHCTPNCTGKCGGLSDGCGGTCDTCPSGQTCLDNKTCILPCDNDHPCPSDCPFCEPVTFVSVRACANEGTGRICNVTDPASCPQGDFCSGAAVCLATCVS